MSLKTSCQVLVKTRLQKAGIRKGDPQLAVEPGTPAGDLQDAFGRVLGPPKLGQRRGGDDIQIGAPLLRHIFLCHEKMERALQEITSRLREIRELIETSACELEEDIEMFEAKAKELAALWDAPHRNLDEEAQAALATFCSGNLQGCTGGTPTCADVEVPPSEVGAVGVQESDAVKGEALAGGVGDAVTQAAGLHNTLGGHA